MGPAERCTGSERLQVFVEGWLRCCGGGVFPRGCFLSASLHEMDGRPGPVRDALAAFNDRVRAAIAEAAEPCLGDSGLTTDDVVARVVGIATAANFLVITGDRDGALRNGRHALAVLLRELSSSHGRDGRDARRHGPPLAPRSEPASPTA